MAKVEMRKLPDSMKIASLHLLLNPKLLKIFIHLAYSKTNILDHKNVVSSFHLVDMWMQML